METRLEDIVGGGWSYDGFFKGWRYSIIWNGTNYRTAAFAKDIGDDMRAFIVMEFKNKLVDHLNGKTGRFVQELERLWTLPAGA
jgi:hypothetical protein